MNPGRTVKYLLAVHPACDDEKLEDMKALKLKGLPPIRVVDCGDHYMAIEGSHRLAAAAEPPSGAEPDRARRRGPR